VIGFVLASALAAGGAAIQPPPAPLPHVIGERTITSLAQPADIRWLDDRDVIVADAMRGLARIPAADPGATMTWLDEWPMPKYPGAHYHHLAISAQYILTADFVFQLQWRARSGDGRLQKAVFESIDDLDLDGDRLLIVGWQRDANGKPADGAIAWLGLLAAGPDSFRPVLPFRSLSAIGGCMLCGLGSARFLKDGSFILVPGAESGVYHFTKDGSLDHVWQGRDLGLEINCEFPRAEEGIMHTQPLVRQQWVNRRAMVDEIIDTPTGPALIVRKFSDGLTQWEMLLLNGPSPAAQKLPFTSPSPWAHISAATRGDRIAFLIGDRLENRKDGAPARLILADWKSH